MSVCRYLSRAYGLTVDNILAATVVVADGSTVRSNYAAIRTEHSPWAHAIDPVQDNQPDPCHCMLRC